MAKNVIKREILKMTLRKKCPMLQFVNLGDNRGNLVVIEGGGNCAI